MKLIKIILICISIVFILSKNVFALGDIFTIGKNWTATGELNTNKTMAGQDVRDVSNDLYNILLAVATIVVIVVGAILGVQFMTAGIDKKVEVKESLFPYIISSIVIFASFGIWKLMVTILKDFNNI